MRLLYKILLILASTLVFLIALGIIDYVTGIVGGLGDYVYARGEELGGGWRFPRVGVRLDAYVSSLILPIAVAIVAVAAFEVLAHEKER